MSATRSFLNINHLFSCREIIIFIIVMNNLLIKFFLIVGVCFIFLESCNSKKSDSTEIESSQLTKEHIETAKIYIEQGNLEEAFSLLHSININDENILYPEAKQFLIPLLF
ncbi:MAG: hypothetical protein LBU51_07550 [Bacteroidales bacterium]|jgi:hypothetical protein|nr:hypothetical protein [Bacteroidales bacterium]